MTETSHNVKMNRILRTALSFVLCFLTVVLSVSVCAKADFTSVNKIEKLFTSESYVTGIRDDVSTYACDIFIKNGISDKNVSDVFDYSRVEEVIASYISFYVNQDNGYSENAYKDAIDAICKDLKGELKIQLKNAGVDYSQKQLDNLVKTISDYFISEVEINHIDYLKTFTNIGSMVSNVISIVSAVFIIGISLVVIFIGKRRYRSVRAISSAFLSAGFIDLFASLILTIISNIKKIDIYPLYLRNILLEYIDFCIGKIALAGFSLLVVSLVVLAIAWKLKRKDK